MNILDTILQAQGGQAVNGLGAQFGLDGRQTQTALSALLPALAGAVTQNASRPGGLDALLGALSGGQHARYLDEPDQLSRAEAVQEGNGILGHLLGSKDVSREVVSRAAAQSGIGADVLKRMLPLVATLLMGGLSQGTRAQAAPAGQGGGLGDVLGSVLGGAQGGGGLASVLGGVLGAGGAAGAARSAGAGGGLLDMLTPMLDRNRDGSALDDILGMAANVLGRR